MLLATGRLQDDEDQGAEGSSRGRWSSAPHSPAEPATPATRTMSLGPSHEVHAAVTVASWKNFAPNVPGLSKTVLK